jgi:hypothetical protein
VRIEIRRFKITILPDGDSYTVESPHPDEAKSKLRFDLQLPIGTQFKLHELKPRIIKER